MVDYWNCALRSNENAFDCALYSDAKEVWGLWDVVQCELVPRYEEATCKSCFRQWRIMTWNFTHGGGILRWGLRLTPCGNLFWVSGVQLASDRSLRTPICQGWLVGPICGGTAEGVQYSTWEGCNNTQTMKSYHLPKAPTQQEASRYR